MAYDFDGTNQYLTADSLASFSEPCTIACWFYPENFNFAAMCSVVNFTNGDRIVLFKNPNDIPGRNVIHAATRIGGTNAYATADYVLDQWQHACGVYTSASSRTIYLDGGNSATSTVTATQTYGTPIVAAAARSAAGGPWGAFLNGRVAELGVWNAALTANEVASLAKGMTCNLVRPQSLVFYAPLIRNLQDVRGGLTITNNNAAIVANHPRVYR
jgi:hypothetical protein